MTRIQENPLPDMEKKQRLVRLRRDLICAREKWEDIVQNKCFERYEIKASARHVLPEDASGKIIYFVSMTDAEDMDFSYTGMRRAFTNLGRRIRNLGHESSTIPHALWLPEIVLEPLKIELTTYFHRSISKIGRETAQGFVNKVHGNLKLSAGEYVLVRPSVKNYRLKVLILDKDGKEQRLVFKPPKWTVCFVPTQADRPSIKRRPVMPSTIERRKIFAGQEFKVIARFEQTELFYAEPSPGLSSPCIHHP